MTGPEQHAATIREAIWGYGSGPYNRQAALDALDALVALAGRAAPFQLEEAATFYRHQMEAAEARADELQQRYDALAATIQGKTAFDVVAEKVDLEIRLAGVEKRADDLQRERDTLEEIQPFPVETVFSWKHRVDSAKADVEQARREADQLRAALRRESQALRTVLMGWRESMPHDAVDCVEAVAGRLSDAALADAPSGPSEADQLREALEQIVSDADRVIPGRWKQIARAALAGVQAKESE